MAAIDQKPRRWYHWFHPDDTPEERRLIVKLDLLIVVYAFVVYWVKYLDQANINNAYVSGLSEELGFHGNELVHFQTMYTVGAVVGQVPFGLIFPKVRMNWLIPGLDLGWGLFTLLQYRTQTASEMMAYRFLVGFFESAFFPGVHFVLGAWYRGDEIGRRGGVFYLGLTSGTLTAGLLQAAAFRNLDGVNGLAGWRWNFIINAIITLPVGIIGFFIWPGTPEKASTLILTHEEISLAKRRLERAGHKRTPPMTWTGFKRTATTWKFWLLVAWATLFWNAGLAASSGSYLLWLKSLHRFSTGRLNDLSTTAPAIGIFYILLVCFGSDLFLGRAGAITLAQGWNFIGQVILSIWNVPEAAKWVAFNSVYSSAAMSSVLYGWANDFMRGDHNARALTLVAMTAIPQSTTAWTPLLVFPTVEGPHFSKGYPFCATFAALLITATWVVRHLHIRQEKLAGKAEEAGLREDGSSEAVVESLDEIDSYDKSVAKTGVTEVK